MSQIRTWLYLGSEKEAKDLDFLKRKKVTHILNVADDVENFFPTEFIYCNLRVKDFGNDEGISRVFPEAFEFVDQVRTAEDGILFVHCLAGVNRSSTLVTAILMKFEKLTLKEAFEAVANARPWVSPFEDNRHHLLKFEKSMLSRCSMDEVDFIYICEAAKEKLRCRMISKDKHVETQKEKASAGCSGSLKSSASSDGNPYLNTPDSMQTDNASPNNAGSKYLLDVPVAGSSSSRRSADKCTVM